MRSLSIGTIAGMASQVPGGAVARHGADKRWPVAGAIIATMASALFIALWPSFLSIAFAEVLHAFAGAVMGPALAALSLALVHPDVFGERLGRNARFAAIGNAVAAGADGGVRLLFFGSRSLLSDGCLLLPGDGRLGDDQQSRFRPGKAATRRGPAARPQTAAGSWIISKTADFSRCSRRPACFISPMRRCCRSPPPWSPNTPAAMPRR